MCFFYSFVAPVAFPTTNSSMDLMSESPNVVDKAQLDILGIEIKDEVKKA